MHRAMEKALRNARMDPSQVNYLNIHGTATSTNDQTEMRAVKSLFGDHAPRLAISGTKPVTGHLLAAAGAIETIVCALALKNQEIPFT
jgi:3-oxoacyl-[acyl-carrier-protein] synthase II